MIFVFFLLLSLVLVFFLGVILSAYMKLDWLKKYKSLCIHENEYTVVFGGVYKEDLITAKCKKCKQEIIYFGRCTVWYTYPGGRCSPTMEGMLSGIWYQEKAIANGTLQRKQHNN